MKILRLIALFFVLMSSCLPDVSAQNIERVQPVDMVYPQLDSEHSRWFFFSSACRPFGMVNLSPDTQTGGAWGSGYRYNTDTIKGFSHIHAWQLSGLSLMPLTIDKSNKSSIFTDFYSKFNHSSEKTAPGYHYLELDRYGITAELSSTTRVGFHKYAFPKKKKAAILFNLNGMLGPCRNVDGLLKQESDFVLSGQVVNMPTVRRPKRCTVYFKIELNTRIKRIKKDESTGNYLVELKNPKGKEVLMKAAISYTSVKNAGINMREELGHWDFEQIVKESGEEWNTLLSRIEVEGASQAEQRRFYTDLWHALQGRRIISDVNGAYPDNTGESFRIGQLPLDQNAKPKFNHYNSDSFWGAQWTLNTLWGLVYPEIYEEFVHSLMQYYKDGGMVPRGPSGGNYTYVMTGATATPFMVSAIQKGIVKEGLEEIYQALKKGHVAGGIMSKAGYEHKTNLGGGLDHYISKGYVPYPIPEGEKFGYHQDGGSLTAEYAYQDWTLAQLAKKLGHKEDAQYFLKRSENYKNVYDKTSGWMRPKNIEGQWKPDFDPYLRDNGFNECNAAQSTWFVPHDITGLAALMGGPDLAVKKLSAQFEAAEKLGFTAGKSHNKETQMKYSRIPINYGNQPSIQTAFVFNHLGRPDLSHYWSRKVVEAAFSGLSTNTGYNGDEDQGLMGSLAVLLKIGLFQLTGGTEKNPVYQIGSPIFDKVTIHLNQDYYPGEKITIQAKGNSSKRPYVESAHYGQREINSFEIDHQRLIRGGSLILKMKN